MFAKTGPGTNRIRRSSPEVWRISVPVMSAGMRSGVNWMRANFRWKTCAIDFTSNVFARPGAPVMRQWPPAKSAMRIWSITSRWPTMDLASSASIRARPVVSRSKTSWSLGAAVAVAATDAGGGSAVSAGRTGGVGVLIQWVIA